MEIIIIVCLLLIIVLFVQDKIVIKRKIPPQKQKPVSSDIMGKSKSAQSQSVPNTATENRFGKREENRHNLANGNDGSTIPDIQIPQEEPEDVSENLPDWEEEEKEWSGYGTYGGGNGFAQGVTFEELDSVGTLLQNEELEPSQKETAAAIVRKIQGTELFALLEGSMEDASRKIAELLDTSLASKTTEGSSSLRNEDDFDIGEFV